MGLKLSSTMFACSQIDRENSNIPWQDAIHSEMAKVLIAFDTVNEDESILPSYQKICCHMVFNMKMEDFHHKAWFIDVVTWLRPLQPTLMLVLYLDSQWASHWL